MLPYILLKQSEIGYLQHMTRLKGIETARHARRFAALRNLQHMTRLKGIETGRRYLSLRPTCRSFTTYDPIEGD